MEVLLNSLDGLAVHRSVLDVYRRVNHVGLAWFLAGARSNAGLMPRSGTAAMRETEQTASANTAAFGS